VPLAVGCYGSPMGQQAFEHARAPAEQGDRAPTARLVARGEGWSISEFNCRLGPGDRRFEERYAQATIAAVIEGTFQHRSAAGTALLYPGSFLLGNAGTGFECGHDHGVGDRCVSCHFDQPLFEEIAAAVAGSHRFRFPAATLPAMQQLALPRVELASATGRVSPTALEESAIRVAETVIAVSSGHARTSSAPSSRDQRRVSNVLRYIEEHADEPLGLEALSAVAITSKYHFLRIFRRIVGITPHQFLLDMRMSRAAVKLCTTSMPISTIAFDTGFGDLSAFNARFKNVFGTSPGRFRQHGKGALAGAPHVSA
jgi:AraC family transcriptional regulator